MKFYRDLDLGLSCTPDAFIVDPERPGFGICQIKSVSPAAFREQWLASDGGTLVTPPIYAVIQVVLEAHLTGASWACVAALVVDREISLHLVDVPLHKAILERIIAEAKYFWRAVRDGKPPEFDYERDSAVISKLYSGESGEVIDLSGVNDLLELIAEDEVLKTRIHADGARRNAIKNRFKAELKEASAITYNGRTIATRKIIHKPGYAVPSMDYAKITLKPEPTK